MSANKADCELLGPISIESNYNCDLEKTLYVLTEILCTNIL